MKLTILGSGTCIPAPNRGNSGYLLETGDSLILIDSGSGALRRVADYGFDYRKIRNVCYSHLHPDHTIDFVPFLFALKNDPDIKELHQLMVSAPVGFREYYAELVEVYGSWIQAEHLEVNITEHERRDIFPIDDITVETGPVVHSEESIAYRFTGNNGQTLVYSGDTGYSEEFAEFAKDADLLVIESAIPEGTDFEGHCSPSDAAKIAELAQAKKTVLTHFYPQVEQEDIPGVVQQYYSGEILLAEDGLNVDI
ncbi:MAG: MBL fold metallo-hydrolase [Candidatus Marinimicrobia bacterium]|nr:MBL fold metallo-hydrolase [Candidatus Neomarinimicrobiota bacterium]MCF7828330.1 MBL fold metallo-hydrolase [Candidatus Neomarinimicrobiota bacterium]MCF7879495.1 MBL fold metallo-hydrolase [Candidatus Neomarinimicrobiota bacterium]